MTRTEKPTGGRSKGKRPAGPVRRALQTSGRRTSGTGGARLIRRQRAFLSQQGHDLRTHLHTLMGYAGLVYRKTKGALPAQQEENLKKILISAEQLREAIDRLYEFPFEDEPE